MPRVTTSRSVPKNDTETSKIVLLGVGIVGSCFLEMLLKTPIGRRTLKRYHKRILAFDTLDKSQDPVVVEMLAAGVDLHLTRLEVLPENIDRDFLPHVKKGDLLVDLSWNVYFHPLIRHCLTIGATYLNTSIEYWKLEHEDDLKTEFIQRTLHESHREARYMEIDNPKSSALLIQGMNPGLISMFALRGLSQVAKAVLAEAKKANVMTDNLKNLEHCLKGKMWNYVAAELDVIAFHCSEYDTQLTNTPRARGSFKNTWSPYGFYAEGVDPIQLGWGTYEHPAHTVQGAVPSYGVPNQIYLPLRGVDGVAESYTYNRKFTGLLISHSENDTLAQFLTVINPQSGEVLYRPSAYYVYSPAQEALDSLNEVRANGYRMLPHTTQIRGTDIVSGEDAVGALLLFQHDPIQRLVYGQQQAPTAAFWCGSILTIEQTRKLDLVHSGPTAVQVGISLLSAATYLGKSKRRGLLFPEDLPHDKILDACEPYLGTIFADWVDYHPKTTRFTGGPGFLKDKTQTFEAVRNSSNCVIL